MTAILKRFSHYLPSVYGTANRLQQQPVLFICHSNFVKMKNPLQ
jgi:hypothetical protein